MQSFDGLISMEQQFFFDKRYSRPFSFEGTQIFNKKNKDSEIKIFEVIDDGVKKYIFVFVGRSNTELYKVERFELLFQYFDNKDSIIFELLKENCELKFEYDSGFLYRYEKSVFSESYKIYKFKKDEQFFLLIVFEGKYIFQSIIGVIDYLLFYRKYLSIFLIKDIDEKTLSFKIYNLRDKEEFKYLNEQSEGEKSFDTGVSSLEFRTCLGLYGRKQEFIGSQHVYNCHIIDSEKGFYLTVNDTIYFDNCRGRLLLRLPEVVYIEYIENFGAIRFDKKYHAYFTNSENDVVNEEFLSKNYKEEVLPLSLKTKIEKFSDKTNSQFLSDDCYLDLGEDFSIFNSDYDYSCGDCFEDLIQLERDFNKYIINEFNFPIYTNAKTLLKKESKGCLYYLLAITNGFLLVIESKKGNKFYNIYHERSLYLLIINKTIPFTYQELFSVRMISNPNNLNILKGVVWSKKNMQ